MADSYFLKYYAGLAILVLIAGSVPDDVERPVTKATTNVTSGEPGSRKRFLGVRRRTEQFDRSTLRAVSKLEF